jgi:hypothetical protein
MIVYQIGACLFCDSGYYQDQEGSSGCTPCPRGSYSQKNGTYNGAANCTLCSPRTAQGSTAQISCSDCDSGKYSDASGLTACHICDAGRYSLKLNGTEGPLECVECAEGTYSSSPGSATCLPCDSGYASNSTGAQRCIPCPIGTKSSESGTGSSACVDCFAGQYTQSPASAICGSCLPGTYSDIPSASGCKPCKAGKYQPTSSASYCSDCTVGTFSSSGNVACSTCGPGRYFSSAVDIGSSTGTCIACEVGRYASLGGLGECTPCEQGYYAPTETSRICTPAPKGTFVAGNTSNAFVECPAGTAAPETASITCVICPDGTFSDTNGTISCTSCAAGRWTRGLTQQTTCWPCEYGYFGTNGQTCDLCTAGTSSNGEQGQTTCGQCIGGTYTSYDGASNCTICQVGKASSGQLRTSCSDCVGIQFSDEPGLGSCKRCSSGQYAAINQLGTTECRICPTGASCAGILSFSFSHSPVLSIIYSLLFCYCVVTKETGIAAEENYYLARQQSNGDVVAFWCLPGLCSRSSSCNTTNIEAAGSTITSCCGSNRVSALDNPLCGACKDGYSEWGGVCVKCDKPNGPLIFMYVVISFAFVMAFHLVSQNKNSGDSTIFIYFVQMCLLFVGPETWIAWTSVFNMNILTTTSSTCIAPITPMQKLLLGVIVPTAIVVELGIVAIVHGLLWLLNHNPRDHMAPHYSWLPRGRTWKKSPYLRTLTAFFFFSCMMNMLRSLSHNIC